MAMKCKCGKAAIFIAHSLTGSMEIACRKCIDFVPHGNGVERFPKGISKVAFDDARIQAKWDRENK